MIESTPHIRLAEHLLREFFAYVFDNRATLWELLKSSFRLI